MILVSELFLMLLGWVATPDDLHNFIDTLSSLSAVQILFGFQILFVGGWIGWLLYDERENLPIIAGGRRLRKLEPMVSDLVALKESDYTGQPFSKLAAYSKAKQLAKKLDDLRVPRPSLLADSHDRDRLLVETTFLSRLTLCCIEGDLKRARNIHRLQ